RVRRAVLDALFKRRASREQARDLTIELGFGRFVAREIGVEFGLMIEVIRNCGVNLAERERRESVLNGFRRTALPDVVNDGIRRHQRAFDTIDLILYFDVCVWHNFSFEYSF